VVCVLCIIIKDEVFYKIYQRTIQRRKLLARQSGGTDMDHNWFCRLLKSHALETGGPLS